MSSQEINEQLQCWLCAFSEEDSQRICSLYDKQAFLWGTLSAVKRDTPSLIKDYFNFLFTFANRQVTLDDAHIRLFGDIAICNGLYRFSWVNIDETIVTQARFSFVYKKHAGRWLIIEHHSSVVPINTQ